MVSPPKPPRAGAGLKENEPAFTTPGHKQAASRGSPTPRTGEGLAALPANQLGHGADPQPARVLHFPSPAGGGGGPRGTPASASRIPRLSTFATKIPTPSAKEARLAAELEAVRREQERLAAENNGLQSALKEARDAIEWLRSEEAQLRSRADVAEESRTATSKVLLSLTEAASRMQVEQAALMEQLEERELEVEEALAMGEHVAASDATLQQEANNEVFRLTEQLAAAEEALAVREAQLAAAQDATALLARREEELLHQLQLASLAVQQEVEDKERTIESLQAEARALALKLETAKTGHQAELAHVLNQMQDNESMLLGKVSKLSKQLTAAQQDLASKERQLEATGGALDQAQSAARKELAALKREHEREVAALRSKLLEAEKAHTKAKSLAKAVASSGEEVADLRRVLEAAQGRAKQLEELLDAAEQAKGNQVAELQRQVAAAEEAARSADKATAAAQAAAAAELEAKLEAAEKQRLAETMALSVSLAAGLQQVQQLQAALEEAVGARVAVEASATAQAAEAERALAALRQQLEASQTDSAASAAEAAALREQLGAAQAQAEDLELSLAKAAEARAAEKEEARAALLAAEAKAASLQEWERELTEEAAAQRQAAEQSGKQVAALQSELQALQAEIGDMQTMAAALLESEGAVEELERQLEEATGQVEQVGRERDVAALDRDTFQEQVTALRADKEGLAAQLAAAQTDLATAQAELASARASLQSTQDQLQAATTREQQLQQRVTELSASPAPAGPAPMRPPPAALRLPPLPPMATAAAASPRFSQPSPRLPCRLTAGSSPRVGSTAGASPSPFAIQQPSGEAAGRSASSRGGSGFDGSAGSSGIGHKLLWVGPWSAGAPVGQQQRRGARRVGSSGRLGGQQDDKPMPAPAALVVRASRWALGLGLAAVGLAAGGRALQSKTRKQATQLPAAQSAALGAGFAGPLPPRVPSPKSVPSKMARAGTKAPAAAAGSP